MPLAAHEAPPVHRCRTRESVFQRGLLGQPTVAEQRDQPNELRGRRFDVSRARRAAQAAQALATRVARTGELPRAQYYADRPLREEVLRRVEGADGTLLGLVTRNAYGCEVLNTDKVMFVDGDPPARACHPSPGARIDAGRSKTHRNSKRSRPG